MYQPGLFQASRASVYPPTTFLETHKCALSITETKSPAYAGHDFGTIAGERKTPKPPHAYEGHAETRRSRVVLHRLSSHFILK